MSTPHEMMSGEILWTPSEGRRLRSRMQAFLDGHDFTTYDDAWRWSVNPTTASEFWSEVSLTGGVHWYDHPSSVMERDSSSVTGVRWFRGGTLNYAELALTSKRHDDDPAIFAFSDTVGSSMLTWREMRELVARLQGGLRRAGVVRGEVVAAYLPNIPETLALMLATVGLGAVWTCCAPEMGATGVLDRLVQTEPKIFVTIDGYRYGEKVRDVRDDAAMIREGLTTLRGAFMLPYLDEGFVDTSWLSWAELLGDAGPLTFAPVKFDHPLYILYSSGTTGKPKAIVHGHGGIMLEHLKVLRYHFDLGDHDRFFWYTTTGWMMWNFCVSGLLVDSTVGLYDGNPSWPTLDQFWRFLDDEEVTCAGVGASYMVTCEKAHLQPGKSFALSHLLTLGATGSPLPSSAAEWVYREVKADVLLASLSGGTDVCSGFVGASPVHQVWGGEISCRCLGAKVEIFDEDGVPVIDLEGEVVITSPLPSMPVCFLNDPDGSRYRAAYFERFKGVWAHGDRATLTRRGTVVITGRSDATLNRGGIRMGTAEFYAVVEGLNEVVDSLVVHLEDPEGGPGELWLFVTTDPATALADLDGTLRRVLRAQLSARHVPDRIVVIPSVPRTLSGKKIEVPIKRILSGADPAAVITASSMANPESLAPFIELAQDRLK